MDDPFRLLAEQRISEYGMRLRRLDERLGHAEKKLAETPDEAEISTQLEKLKRTRSARPVQWASGMPSPSKRKNW